MMTVEITWHEIDKGVDEVLQLSEALKASLNGVYDDNDLRNALITLLTMELGLYGKLATIFKNRSTSKIIEFAAIARLLLESHATICWILDSKGDEQVREKCSWRLVGTFRSITITFFPMATDWLSVLNPDYQAQKQE